MTTLTHDTKLRLVKVPGAGQELRELEEARSAQLWEAGLFFVKGALCFVPFLAVVVWAVGLFAAGVIIGLAAVTGVITGIFAVRSDRRQQLKNKMTYQPSTKSEISTPDSPLGSGRSPAATTRQQLA